MKYFGKKSLSSVVSIFLRITWYVVIALASFAVLLGIICIFSEEARNLISSEIIKGMWDMNSQDRNDFQWFLGFPLALKFFLVPYLGVYVVVLLQIIKKSQLLFTNFKNDIVFDNSNAMIILKISKLNIVFAVLTANCVLLLVSILLLIICEIFKKGSVLQAESDLTV
jgi:hypothetical protein